MPFIEVRNLSKIFKTPVKTGKKAASIKNFFKPEFKLINAVDGISFDAEKGESIAYLGPNGAGKSTTIKMLTGVLAPSGGGIKINGIMPHKQRKKNSYQIGVLFGQRSQLIHELPVRDSYELIRYMYDIPLKDCKNRIDEFASALNISELLPRQVRTLSLGQRMRCEMLAALLHQPEVLFLDEPTIGLDVLAKEHILNFIKKMNKEKKVTVLLTTHDFTDIESLCQRLIIIDYGRIIYDGSLRLIRDRLATEKKVTVKFGNEQAKAKVFGLLSRYSLNSLESRGLYIDFSFDQTKTDISLLLRKMLAISSIDDMVIQDESIESIIKRIYASGIPGENKTPKKIKK